MNEILRKTSEPNFWLDIGILSIIIYRILLSLRQQVLIRIIVGVALLTIIYLFANTLNLPTLNWLMESIYSHLVILMIIIFQPELRHLISELTFTKYPPIIRYFASSYTPNHAIIPELVSAITNMAKQKIGSIIAILSDHPAQDIIRGGQPMKAAVTKELVQTIFQKKSLLHDGALVIDDGNVVAAACYLPMTESDTVQKKYGARHRAGLGMSEQTDAILIVTSEETGEINIIHKAKIINCRANELGNKLKKLL